MQRFHDGFLFDAQNSAVRHRGCRAHLRGLFVGTEHPLRRRLARILLLLAHFAKEGKPESVVPKISQETLAEMIGTTRSRVSFFMNRFRELRFIHYNGGLQVHSSLLNVVLHD